MAWIEPSRLGLPGDACQPSGYYTLGNRSQRQTTGSRVLWVFASVYTILFNLFFAFHFFPHSVSQPCPIIYLKHVCVLCFPLLNNANLNLIAHK